jgi:hypothetical protein
MEMPDVYDFIVAILALTPMPTQELVPKKKICPMAEQTLSSAFSKSVPKFQQTYMVHQHSNSLK